MSDFDRSVGISKEYYFFLIDNGIPYEGPVEGLGYALKVVEVIGIRVNKYNDQFMKFSYSPVCVGGFSENISPQEGENYLGLGFRSLSIGTGLTLNYLGTNNISTRGKFAGATPGTSMASLYFRNTTWGQRRIPLNIYNKIPKRIQVPIVNNSYPLRSPTWGGFAGRMTPVVGRGFIYANVAMSGYNIATSENKPKAVAKEAGGWAGAWVGAKLGAEGGAIVGVWFEGVGAVPGAIIGGIIFGGIGYFVGSEGVEIIYNDLFE